MGPVAPMSLPPSGTTPLPRKFSRAGGVRLFLQPGDNGSHSITFLEIFFGAVGIVCV